MAYKVDEPVAKKKRAAAPSKPVGKPIEPTTTTARFDKEITIVQVEAYSREHAKRLTAALYGVPLGQVIDADLETQQTKPATKAILNDIPQRGARKWITNYEIYTYAQKIPVGRNKFEYLGLEFVKGGFQTKTEAVQMMRDFAVKHTLPMMVKIVKVLEDDDNVTATAEPIATKGRYTTKFFT